MGNRLPFQKFSLFVCLILVAPFAMADDLVKLNGVRMKGKILRETPQLITIQIMVGTKSRELTVPVAEIESVTIDGKKRILNSRTRPTAPGKKNGIGPKSSTTSAPSSPPTDSSSGNSAGNGPTRSRAEVEALILQEGRTPPAWWDSVSVNPPKTLKLDWPVPQQKEKWNNQVNMGQYLWDVINPNPKKWQEGARLLHEVLQKYGKDAGVRQRATNALGHLYADCMEDYARGAFWWRINGTNTTGLANCYWKLGCKEMAEELLQKAGADNTRNGSVIRMWADMGETETALTLANARIRSSSPDVGYLAAGYVCRMAGRYSESLRFYEQVLTVKQGSRDLSRNQDRARNSIQAIKVYDSLDLARVGDGTYKNSALGYEAPVEVEVKVQSGKIDSVRVTQHREKQFYSALTETPNQIIRKQSVKGIDATSGATITSEAIINATAKALAGGMK